MKDGPDDGEADAVLGWVQGEGGAGGAARGTDHGAVGGQARHSADDGGRREAAGPGGSGVGILGQGDGPEDGEGHRGRGGKSCTPRSGSSWWSGISWRKRPDDEPRPEET